MIFYALTIPVLPSRFPIIEILSVLSILGFLSILWIIPLNSCAKRLHPSRLFNL